MVVTVRGQGVLAMPAVRRRRAGDLYEVTVSSLVSMLSLPSVAAGQAHEDVFEAGLACGQVQQLLAFLRDRIQAAPEW